MQGTFQGTRRLVRNSEKFVARSLRERVYNFIVIALTKVTLSISCSWCKICQIIDTVVGVEKLYREIRKNI